MAVLAQPVALHDIRDAEAFVQATLNASKRVYGPDEREELVAEGLRIMVELARNFTPRRDGYDKDGRFSGYAAKFLRLKLEDAYHRLHPEHRLVTQPDGRRRYLYGDRAVSLDALTGEDPDREVALAGHDEISDMGIWLHQMLSGEAEQQIEQTMRVGRLRHQGFDEREIASKLRMSVEQVRRCNALINDEDVSSVRRRDGLSLREALHQASAARVATTVLVAETLVTHRDIAVSGIVDLLGLDARIVRAAIESLARFRSELEVFANRVEAADVDGDSVDEAAA